VHAECICLLGGKTMGQQNKGKESVPVQRSGQGGQGEESRAMSRPPSDVGRQTLAQNVGITPFSFVRRMMEDMDRMFGGGFGMSSLFDDMPMRSALGPLGESTWAPQIEVFEHDGNLLVRADLPGLDRNDVRVSVDDHILTIEGERQDKREEKREGYFHSERTYGSFQRRIALPRGADASTCDATFENGVLEIRMKLPQQSSRRVEIRGGAGQQSLPSQGAQPSQTSQPSQSTQGAQSQQRPANGPAAPR
jgi:HSP20 family protein